MRKTAPFYFPRSLVLSGLVGAAFFILPISTFAADTYLAAVPGASTCRFGMSGPILYGSQSFVSPVSGTLDEAAIYMADQEGSPTANVSQAIYTNSAGSPGASLTSAVVGGVNNAWATTTQGATVVSGTTYWLVITGSGGSQDGSNKWGWRGNTSVTSGVSKDSSDGSTWNNADCYTGSGKTMSYTLSFTTIGGGEEASSTATTTMTLVYNPSQTIFNGMLLFLLTMGGIAFYFRTPNITR